MNTVRSRVRKSLGRDIEEALFIKFDPSNAREYAMIATQYHGHPGLDHKNIPSLHELNPERWAEHKRLEEHESMPVMPATTDLFTCPRCREKKCVYEMVQTRSGDEGMTASVECIPCGFKFRS